MFHFSTKPIEGELFNFGVRFGVCKPNFLFYFFSGLEDEDKGAAN